MYFVIIYIYTSNDRIIMYGGTKTNINIQTIAESPRWRNNTNSLQFVSSLPSTQSRRPLHLAVSGIHVPLPQRN